MDREERAVLVLVGAYTRGYGEWITESRSLIALPGLIVKEGKASFCTVLVNLALVGTVSTMVAWWSGAEGGIARIAGTTAPVRIVGQSYLSPVEPTNQPHLPLVRYPASLKPMPGGAVVGD